MLFVIGVLCLIVGVIMAKAWGTTRLHYVLGLKSDSRAEGVDVASGLIIIVGLILVLVSLGIKFWHVLP